MANEPRIIQLAVNGNLDKVRALLAAGENVNTRSIGNPFLHRGSPEDDSGPAKNATPLMIAAKLGHMEMLELLLANGADIHATARGFEGEKLTVLYCAVRAGHLTVVRHLLAAGIVPTGKVYESILIDAVATTRYFYQRCVTSSDETNLTLTECLVAAGASIHSGTNKAEDTALSIAARFGGTGVVQFLLKQGAKPSTTKDGYSDLMAALPHIDCMRLLLSGGAEVNAIYDHYQSVLDMAESYYVETEEGVARKAAIIQMLLDAGAKRGSELVSAKPVEILLPLVRPDWTVAASQPDFQNQLRRFAEMLSAEPQPMFGAGDQTWVNIAGAYVFPGHQKQIEDLVEKIHASKLLEGVFCFVHWNGRKRGQSECQLGVLPTAEKYEAVSVIQPSGANYDVGPENVVEMLKEIEAIQPFHLTGLGYDQVTLRFIEPLAIGRKLAAALSKIKADLQVPSEPDFLYDPPEIQKAIRRDRRITLFWEH